MLSGMMIEDFVMPNNGQLVFNPLPHREPICIYGNMHSFKKKFSDPKLKPRSKSGRENRRALRHENSAMSNH